MNFVKKVPQHIFVGSLNGVTSCSSDENYHEIWPKFMIMVFFTGSQKFEIDGQLFCIDSGNIKNNSPITFMINIAQFSQIRFFNDSQIPLKKVLISAPLPWVETVFDKNAPDMPLITDFLQGHLNHFSFAPNNRIIAAAEQIITPTQCVNSELMNLRNNTLGMDIIYEACTHFVNSKNSQNGLKPINKRDQDLAEKTRDFLLTHLTDCLTMREISKAMAANITSLQRSFKAHYHVTIFDFIRKERLEKARILLETRGIAVSQAAYLTGYDSPASFTTAFRKEFGVSPKYHKS